VYNLFILFFKKLHALIIFVLIQMKVKRISDIISSDFSEKIPVLNWIFFYSSDVSSRTFIAATIDILFLYNRAFVYEGRVRSKMS